MMIPQENGIVRWKLRSLKIPSKMESVVGEVDTLSVCRKGTVS